jgi:alpha-glucosidase
MLTLLDIDYMDEHKVFTLGEKFPLDGMRKLVSDLHGNDQHYIVMVDPGSCSISH